MPARPSPSKKKTAEKAVKKSTAPAGPSRRDGKELAVASEPRGKSELFPIVGIGASAGGFEAMQELLAHLPPDTGMAFVFIAHLDPRAKSHAPALLQKTTAMQVQEIRDKMVVEPNSIYTLAPAQHVTISERVFSVQRIGGGKHVSMPIDHFFESLARSEGPRAIGVVLSGTGSDGTLGLGAIKSEGGLTFAQSERSAKYFGMPGSAISAGCVDAMLAPAAIVRQLVEIAKHPYVKHPETVEREGEGGLERESELSKIFQILRNHTGVNFALYKRSTMQRRITRRLVLHRVAKLGDYVKLLRLDNDEVEALYNDLLINVTSFFRDREVYTALQKKILPKMIRSRRGAADGGELRFWVPGCASGEEVYSLAIITLEALRKAGSPARLQIFGTDLSEHAISKARAGSYPATAVENVPPDWLRKYFRKDGDRYQITRSIRDLCTFARQNVPQDPPFSRLDLISCRNVLIYLGVELQRRCFPIFHYSLNPGGYLLLGSAETVGGFGELFSVAEKHCKIYQKKTTAARPEVEFGGVTAQRRPETPRTSGPSLRGREIQLEIQREADRLVLLRAAPAGVVTNSDLHVLQFRGQTGRFLEHNAGEASLNLLQMAKQPLVMDLRATIHKALKGNTPVYCEDIPLPGNGSPLLVNIEVHPFRVPSIGTEQCLLILFYSRPVIAGATDGAGLPHPATKRVRAAAPSEVLRLREELRMTKESLQSIIEEQEATNEELKSANEEIESSNEELQSSNEELETAKEELQSTNEELQTLNEELNTRNNEMSQVNNDLENLLASMNLPVVMVDNALAVRRSTPQAQKLFNLIPTDVGRRLSDISTNLRLPDLEQMIKGVIDDLRMQEREVEDKQGRHYSMRIRPYRTRDHRIDGAVITLMDIEGLRKVRQREGGSREQIASMLEMFPGPAIAVSGDGVVVSANKAFRNTFKLKKAEAETPLATLHGGAWNTPAWRKYIAFVRQQAKGPVREVLPVKLPSQPQLDQWHVSGTAFGMDEALTILLTFEPQ